jgi:hypothetical protein
MNYVLNQNDTKPGDCVFQALIDQFSKSRMPIKESIVQLREITGIAGWGVSIDELSHIEERFVRKAQRKNAKEHRVGFAIYDAHLKLRRLPPYRKSDGNHRYFCHLVTFNNHAYTFKGDTTAQACLERGISYFRAVLQAADHEGTYEDGYKLFLETQHLQPDTERIDDYLNEKLGVEDVRATVELKPSGTSKVWRAKKNAPGVNGMLVEWMQTEGLKKFMEDNPYRREETWHSAVQAVDKLPKYISAATDFEKVVSGIGPKIAEYLTEAPWYAFKPTYVSKGIPRFIRAKGFLARCKKLGIAPYDRNAVSREWEELTKLPLQFPTVEFAMNNVISMDLETCSVKGQEGRFMTYAVGWRFRDQYWKLVAETEEELETNGVLWKAIQAWVISFSPRGREALRIRA